MLPSEFNREKKTKLFSVFPLKAILGAKKNSWMKADAKCVTKVSKCDSELCHLFVFLSYTFLQCLRFCIVENPLILFYFWFSFTKAQRPVTPEKTSLFSNDTFWLDT